MLMWGGGGRGISDAHVCLYRLQMLVHALGNKSVHEGHNGNTAQGQTMTASKTHQKEILPNRLTA